MQVSAATRRDVAALLAAHPHTTAATLLIGSNDVLASMNALVRDANYWEQLGQLTEAQLVPTCTRGGAVLPRSCTNISSRKSLAVFRDMSMVSLHACAAASGLEAGF
jgi:hypothetical protein